MNIKHFINQRRIGFNAEWADSNPNMDDMPAGSSHWKCRLRHKGRQMTVPFSQGPAISHEPTAADVLNCLASDAGSIEDCGSFEEWARDLGYDPDSRKAERIFKTCEKQSSALKRLLGPDDYHTLIYDVERL